MTRAKGMSYEEYRARQNAYTHKWRKKNPKYRTSKKVRERDAELRSLETPENRAIRLAYLRAHKAAQRASPEGYARVKAQELAKAERIKADPVLLARQRAAWRRRDARKAARAIKPATAEQMLQAARDALPRGLPRDVRDDIIGIIMLAALEGQLTLAEIGTRAKDYINVHYRQFTKFGITSIDMPLAADSTRTLHDVLSTENAVLL